MGPDFTSPTAPSDSEEEAELVHGLLYATGGVRRFDTIALELESIANDKCPCGLNCRVIQHDCPIIIAPWDCYKTCVGATLCGDISASIIRKLVFYVFLSVTMLTFAIHNKLLNQLVAQGYVYDSFIILYDRILETVILLMAFYVFAVIVRARDIEVQMRLSIDQHKKALDNLYGLAGVVSNAIGVREEIAFRTQIAKWFTAGFAFWTYLADAAALPVHTRQQMAEMMMKDGILTQDEYQSLHDRSRGTFVDVHRILYAWCARLQYDMLMKTDVDPVAWDTINETLTIGSILDLTLANRNADFSFAYLMVVESFIMAFNITSTGFLAYKMLHMASMVRYDWWLTLTNWQGYGPILRFCVNIIFFESLYAVAKEAADPLDDQTHNQQRYYLLIKSLKRDLFAMFVEPKPGMGDSSAGFDSILEEVSRPKFQRVDTTALYEQETHTSSGTISTILNY